MSVVVCTECGNESDGDELFCDSCGTYLGWWGEKLEGSPQAVVEAEAQAEGDTATATAVMARAPGAEATRRPPKTMRQAWRSVPGEIICQACENPSPPSAHFCRTCGTVLVGTPPVEERSRWDRVVRRRRVLRAGERPGWTRLRSEGPRRIPKQLAILAGGTVAATAFAVLCVWLWAHSVGHWAGGVAHRVRLDVYPYYDPIRPANASGDPQTKAHPGSAAFDRDLTTFWLSPSTNGQKPPTGIGGRLVANFRPATDIDRISIFAGDPTGAELVPSRLRVGFYRWSRTAKGHWLLVDSTGISLANQPGYQTFPVTERGIGLAVITVKGVYAADSPGTAAITEIEFFKKH